MHQTIGKFHLQVKKFILKSHQKSKLCMHFDGTFLKINAVACRYDKKVTIYNDACFVHNF